MELAIVAFLILFAGYLGLLVLARRRRAARAVKVAEEREGTDGSEPDSRAP